MRNRRAEPAERGERLRVRLRLCPEADAEAVLAAAEEVLGRPIGPVLRLPAVRLLSLNAAREELKLLEALPGVERAELEGRCELPPRPPAPGRERE